jgi:hypothetical protein
MPVVAISGISLGFQALSGFPMGSAHPTLHQMRKNLRTKCRKLMISLRCLRPSYAS